MCDFKTLLLEKKGYKLIDRCQFRQRGIWLQAKLTSKASCCREKVQTIVDAWSGRERWVPNYIKTTKRQGILVESLIGRKESSYARGDTQASPLWFLLRGVEQALLMQQAGDGKVSSSDTDSGHPMGKEPKRWVVLVVWKCRMGLGRWFWAGPHPSDFTGSHTREREALMETVCRWWVRWDITRPSNVKSPTEAVWNDLFAASFKPHRVKLKQGRHPPISCRWFQFSVKPEEVLWSQKTLSDDCLEWYHHQMGY